MPYLNSTYQSIIIQIFLAKPPSTTCTDSFLAETLNFVRTNLNLLRAPLRPKQYIGGRPAGCDFNNKITPHKNMSDGRKKRAGETVYDKSLPLKGKPEVGANAPQSYR